MINAVLNTWKSIALQEDQKANKQNPRKKSSGAEVLPGASKSACGGQCC